MARLANGIAGFGEAVCVTSALAHLTSYSGGSTSAVAIVATATIFGAASRGDATAWVFRHAFRSTLIAAAWVAGRLAGHAYFLGKRIA